MKKLLIDYAEVISRPFPDTAMTELAQRAAMSASDFRQRYWEYREPYDCGQSPRDYWQKVLGADYKLGDEITVELFNDTHYVDVHGTSKGKGFQGVVKRHGFGGVGQSTHGQDDRLRAPGAVGACSYPAKVFKGTRMGGQMGNKRVTVQNLEVIKVMPEHNILVLKGSVPGAKGSIIAIEK